MLPFEQLIEITPSDEIQAEVLSLLTTAGLPTTAWQDGSWVRTIIASLSVSMSGKTAFGAEVAKGGLGDLASSDWLTLYADSIYDVQRIEAEAATGLVDLTNSSATIYTLAAGELIVALTSGTFAGKTLSL